MKYRLISNSKSYGRILSVSMIALLMVMAAITPLLHFTTPSSGRILSVMPTEAGYSASIWTTDEYGNPKTDFAPGDIVYIHGTGFLSWRNVDIDITRPNCVVDSGSTMTDSAGSFVYEYDLNGILGLYIIVATDGTNLATTTFTDAVHVDFRQYANLDDLWINSILQKSNSKYYEGMSVPQRLVFVDIESNTGNVHTLTLAHQATKGGFHAYDWLTAWNQGNVPPLTYTPWGDNIGPHVTTAICQSLHLQSGANEIFVDVPNDPFISKDDTPPTLTTQTRIDAYESAYGNRQIRICGNQPITSASFASMTHDVANGGDTGDSKIDYELTWVSASDQILIELAGHLAMSGNPTTKPIAWGPGLGASQIHGGPYHFKLDELDGHNLGSRDNQIKGADVQYAPGVEVTKTAIPSSGPPGTDVTFTISLTNSGDVELATVTVVDTLPAGMTPISAVPPYDSSIENLDGTWTVTWNNVGSLAADGGSTVVTFDSNIDSDASGTMTNWVDVTANPPIGDPVSASDSTPITVSIPGINVVKTASPTSGAASTDVTFTITVTNTGEVDLDPVEVVDTLPAGMSPVSSVPAYDSSIDNGGDWTVTWNNVGPLTASGGSTVISFIAHIDSVHLVL